MSASARRGTTWTWSWLSTRVTPGTLRACLFDLTTRLFAGHDAAQEDLAGGIDGDFDLSLDRRLIERLPSRPGSVIADRRRRLPPRFRAARPPGPFWA